MTIPCFTLTNSQSSVLLVGGVVQWLGRCSLAGQLSLIYAWSMVDMWPLRGQRVRYGSTNQVGQLSLPSLRGR